MKFINATKLYRKSGGMGHPLVRGQEGFETLAPRKFLFPLAEDQANREKAAGEKARKSALHRW
jgi:hypothetical protein